MTKEEKIRRFEEMNKEVVPGQIVCAGSSLMEMFPVEELVREKQIHMTIYNRGVGGFITDELLENIDTCILDLKPSKLFINIGTNDLSNPDIPITQMIDHYDQILCQVKAALPDVKLYLMAYYPINYDAATEEMKPCLLVRTNQKIAEANAAVKKLAEKHHAKYIDINDPLKDENGNLINMGGIPDYHEGTYVVKRDGVYYMMYADAYVRNEDNEYGTKGAHNRQRYVYSTVSPKGPWKIPTGDNSLSSEPDGAKGVILDPESSDTSHGSIVQFKNQWYMFYHTMDLSGNGALRSFQADKLTFTDDTIDKVIQTDGSELLIGDREIIADADVVYEAEDAEFANTNTEAAQPNTEKFEYNGNQITAVTNLMIPGAYVAFNNADGGENGGRGNIKLKYSAKTQCYAKLIVNGRDYSFINLMGTGGKGLFKGESNITVTMKPGENNTISLTEFNSAVSLDSIELRYLDK